MFFILKQKKYPYSDQTMILFYLFCVLFFTILQVFFWFKTEHIKPNLGIVPEVPTYLTLKAMSLGDDQWIFRTKGLRIQNSGDTFGRFSPLKNYDYKKLSAWFKLLDEFDSKSNYIPSMASYYFSATQNKDDVIYLVDYLEEHSDKNPEMNWWWYYQATFLANHEVKNKDVAIRLARKLKNNSPLNAPLWTKQMLPIILKDMGEKCESLRVMIEIGDNYNKGDIKDDELNYMNFFIQQRMKELKDDKNFNINDCTKQ
jgi:hypothetical protein